MKCLISSAHSNHDGGFFRALAYRCTDCLPDISTNVSQGAVDSFVNKKATSKYRMIPMYNGIDLAKFSFSSDARMIKRTYLKLTAETKLILAIGRLTPAKDYKNLLTAFSKINNHGNMKLAIIGEGNLEKELRDYSLNLEIESNVFWLGIQHDIVDWLSACDLFVLSSQWEGFGLVVAEAMACERPIVATDVGGVSEVVGNSNLLVPSANPEALKSKIIEVLNYTEEYKRLMTKKGRDRIKNNFSLDRLAIKWLDLYTSLSH